MFAKHYQLVPRKGSDEDVKMTVCLAETIDSLLLAVLGLTIVT